MVDVDGHSNGRLWLICPVTMCVLLLLSGPVAALPLSGEDSIGPPVEEFSPGFLGMLRKVLDLEPQILRYADKYDVDPVLAEAVCMYESGGNAGLSSSAGASGYFQLMPATRRSLGVQSNVEAGIKYLGELIQRFGREDYALAGYNGGPTRVARAGPMPLESLQYVLGVGNYRAVLQLYGPSVRAHARTLRLTTVGINETWWTLSARLRMPMVQLRLHNPFLAGRPLRPGQRVAYPPVPRADLFPSSPTKPQYVARLGDNYLSLAIALGVTPASFRESNALWRLQSILPGSILTIPVDLDSTSFEYAVGRGEDLGFIAARWKTDPWTIVRDNRLWNQEIGDGAVLRIRPPRPAAAASPQAHRVARGDTLTSIARRYGTTVAALQAKNALGRSTRLVVGQRLRVP